MKETNASRNSITVIAKRLESHLTQFRTLDLHTVRVTGKAETVSTRAGTLYFAKRLAQ